MMDDAAIRERCEEIRMARAITTNRCLVEPEHAAYLLQEEIYRTAFADGQRAGMERAAKIAESTFPYAATDAERFAVNQLWRAANAIRQAAGEVERG